MSIKEQIAALPDKEAFRMIPAFPAIRLQALNPKDLKALADSHTRLLTYLRSLDLQGPSDEYQYAQTIIKEAEKL